MSEKQMENQIFGVQLEPWCHGLPVVRMKKAVLSEKGLKIEDIFHWQVCPFI